MLCLLPFSLTLWAWLIWWAFQQVPMYASQLVDELSSWTQMTAASATMLPHGGDGDSSTMRGRAADPMMSDRLSSYPQAWRWGRPFIGAELTGFGNFGVAAEAVIADRVGNRHQEDVDPFGAASFLDRLRHPRSEWPAFTRPQSLFPISRAAASASLNGSSLESISRISLALPRTVERSPYQPLPAPAIALMEAEFLEHFGVDTRVPIPE